MGEDIVLWNPYEGCIQRFRGSEEQAQDQANVRLNLDPDLGTIYFFADIINIRRVEKVTLRGEN